MKAPSRTPLNAPVGPARPQTFLTREDLAAAVGITTAGLARLERLGLVEPAAPGGDEFSAAIVARLRRVLRLHADLGVNLVGAAIMVELLERLESLARRPP